MPQDELNLDRFFDALPNAGDHEAQVHVRDASKREIGIRLLPWEVPALSKAGPEVHLRGSFDGVDPTKVVLRMEHKGVPVGRGVSYENRTDGPYMVFKAAGTPAGDEALTLASEGIVTGASPSFLDVPGGTQIHTRGGARLRVVSKADLRETSLTWLPTWNESQVLMTRSTEEKENPVPEAVVQPEPQAPVIDLGPLAEVLRNQTELQTRSFDSLSERLDKIEEHSRADIVVPGVVADKKKANLAGWSSVAIKLMTSQPVSQKELHERALDDIITSENPGLVPDALRNDLLIGVVNRRRPFLESTTQITAPETGMSIVVPVLSERATVGKQNTEKAEVTSTALKVTTQSFDAVTIAGAADVSIQMIRRADPSFMDLLIRDLGHDYARKSDVQALTALFAAGTTPGGANIDPENLLIGEAWENSMSATDEPPDTIWLSAAGVSAFINAKNDGTNSPLYFRLNASFSVGGGTGGDVSALRPVYVPGLDSTGVDVMIGPSSGFAWAEDGAIRLETDVPAKAGRDIGLVGILFFIPRYPAAFTTYDLGS